MPDEMLETDLVAETAAEAELKRRYAADPIGMYQSLLSSIRTNREFGWNLRLNPGYRINRVDFCCYEDMSDADIAMLVIRSTIPDFEKPAIIQVCPECGEKINVIDYPEGLGSSMYQENDTQSPGYLDDGEYICHSCFESMLDDGEVYKCERCGSYYREKTHPSFITDNQRRLCTYCENNYTFTCDCCGGVYTNELRNSTVTGDYVCNDCANENYVRCTSCEMYVHQDEAEWIDDEPYCRSCAEEVEEDEDERFEEDDAYVHVYNWKPRGVFYDEGTLATNYPDTSKVYFGIELEVSGSQRHAPAFLDFFNDTDFGYEKQVYLKSDCSIRNGGFEIVTHPMTFEYIKNTFAKTLQSALDDLKKKQFKGHNYGGMHVHMSRSAIPYAQYERLVRMFSDPRNKKAWLFLTQRKEEELNRWGTLDIGYLLARGGVYLEQDYNNHYTMNSNRYVAVNTTENTVELRVFNSNLRIERVLKNIEICQALLDFTAPKQRHNLSMPAFIKYVRKHKDKFSNLAAFLDEKNWDDTFATCFVFNEPDEVTNEA